MSPIATEQRPPSPTIDPRLRARRIAVMRDEGRRRLHLLTGLAGIVALGAATVGIALSPLLDVDSVGVVGAAKQAPATVVDASGVERGEQLVLLDEDGAEDAIEALPWVDEAEVVRSWPGGVEITVVERTPVAGLVEPDGRLALVDAERRVLDIVPADAAPPVVVPVRGAPAVGRTGAVAPSGAAGAIAVVVALPDSVRPLVAGVEVEEDGSLSISLRLSEEGRPTTVLIGDGGLDDTLTALATVVASVSLVDLATIDLRVPSAPALTRR